MIPLPITTIVLGLALTCASFPSPLHPHHPRATIVAGTKGNVTVTWFTVPFNAERLKGLSDGFTWHLGFAQLKTEIPLQCGGIRIAPGAYKFNARYAAEDKTWSVVLLPGEVMQLDRQLRRAKRRGRDTGELEEQLAALAKKGVKELVLPSQACAGKHREHMRIYAINYGYPTRRVGSVDPIGGVEAEYRISFGDLHTSIALREITDEPDKDEKKGEQDEKRDK